MAVRALNITDGLVAFGPGTPSTPVEQVAPKLLLVEDHPILRDGLCALIGQVPGFDVVGAVGTAAEGLSYLNDHSPDVVITELVFPDQQGVKFIQDCKAACPTAKILVLTACNTEEHIREALNAGATGYVLKDSGSADLINGILEVANGGLYVCSTVWSKIVNRFLTGNNHFEMPALRGESDLTGREFQILKVIARGYSNKEISRELKISVKTVEKHRSNLMRKLDLHNTASVTMFAIKNGLLQANEVFSKR